MEIESFASDEAWSITDSRLKLLQSVITSRTDENEM